MVIVYHQIVPEKAARFLDDVNYRPTPEDLELVAVISGARDADEAFNRTVHDEGDPWTQAHGVTVVGDPRGKRSSHEGDVFVTEDGVAYLALPIGFRRLDGLRLPYLP